MRPIFLLLFSAILFSGCSTMEPALSVSDSESLQTYDVKGRQGFLINQKLQFGDYETSKVKRSWTRGGNTRLAYPFGTIADPDYPNLISMDYVNRDQAYYFQMNDAYGNISDVYSTSAYNARDLQIGENPNSVINILQDIFGRTDYAENLFYLQLYINDEPRPWQLLLDNHSATFNNEYQGFFALDDQTFFTLKPIANVYGKNGQKEVWTGSSLGFEIFNSSNESVGAVSLIDNGKVYLNTNDPKERFILANLSAALLLQQDIEEEL